MFTDSHCHAFDDRINFSELNLEKVKRIVVCSYDITNLEKCLNFCKEHKKCFCALGVHPAYAKNFDEKVFLEILNKNKNHIIAIGEIGLDSKEPDREKQIKVFLFQLQLANKLNLPASVHLRTKEDFNTFFDLKKNYPNVKCVFHCFLGDEQDLQKGLNQNCFFSFAGNLTYKRNEALRNILKLVPLEKLLIETDSPGMLPSCFGKRGTNSPQNIEFVANQVAKTLEKSTEEIAKITTQNAEKIFKFKR